MVVAFVTHNVKQSFFVGLTMAKKFDGDLTLIDFV